MEGQTMLVPGALYRVLDSSAGVTMEPWNNRVGDISSGDVFVALPGVCRFEESNPYFVQKIICKFGVGWIAPHAYWVTHGVMQVL